MHWYKVTFDAQGKLTSCTQMEALGDEDTPGVVYIQAQSPEQAVTGAVRLQERLRTRARRARYKREGKCHCSAPLEEGDDRVCKRCLRLQQESLERRVKKSMGLPVVEKTRQETMAEGKAERLSAAELQLLLEVKQAWKRVKTVTAFSVWLKKRLEQAGATAEEAKVGALNIMS